MTPSWLITPLAQPVVLCLLVLLTSACADTAAGDATAFDGPGVAITVAPLDLPGITNAEYNLTVRNAATQVVFTTVVDADTFGDGAGSVTFVGPCDAQSNDNIVSVELLRLFGGSPEAELTDFQNPGVQTRSVTCNANEDVAVNFNLAILRDASQGFFDVAVSFSNIFCSAKLDCNDAFLFNDGVRDETLILALACAGNSGAGAETVLYMSDVAIDCDGGAGTATIDPEGGPGNLVEGTDYTQTGGPLFAAATYRGEESLPGINKRFWNVAMGFDTASGLSNCTINATATASDGELPGGATPEDTSYPFIRYSVVHQVGNATACVNHGLGDDNGVGTEYAAVGAPLAFANSEPPSAPFVPDAPRTVFLTSTSHQGHSIGGLAGADAICQTRAEAAGLAAGGAPVFMAWLSTDAPGEHPAARFVQSTGPYVRVDGVTVADDWADLTDGALAAAIEKDETNGPPASTTLWSYTGIDGLPTLTTTANCNGWDGGPVGGSTGARALSGSAFSGTPVWTETTTDNNCDFFNRLYCFEQ